MSRRRGKRTVRAVGVVAALLGLVACASDGSSAHDSSSTSAGPGAPVAPAVLPTARTEVAGAVWQGRIIVVGGLTEAGAASAQVDLYDPGADRWDPAPALPLGLHHFGLAATGDRVYVAGGYHNPTPGAPWEAQAKVLSLGPGDGGWREEAPMAAARGGLALAALGDRLVAIGGTGADGAGICAAPRCSCPGVAADGPRGPT